MEGKFSVSSTNGWIYVEGVRPSEMTAHSDGGGLKNEFFSWGGGAFLPWLRVPRISPWDQRIPMTPGSASW